MLPEDLIAKALEAPNPIEEVFALIEAEEIETRDLGGFIADNADGSWLHPWASEGFAYIALGGGAALAAAWDDAGFWDVWETTEEEAEAEIAARELLGED